MTAPPLAAILGFDYTALIFVAVGLVVFVVFVLASRPISNIAADRLRSRHMRADVIVVVRRAITFAVIGIGLIAALAFALESANVALFGLVLATIVAALGVQDLLKDYVSGYYILLERHIRVGDHINFNGHQGTITDVRLRVTLLKSDDGDVIVVPNSELFTKPVTIHTSQPTEAKPAPPT
jgi:small-conductance mechanosensitive channel